VIARALAAALASLLLVGLVLVGLTLAGCVSKGSLEGSQVQIVRVEGRRYEVRIARAEGEGEYRIFVVRATMVINPDPQRESERNWNVVRPFMEQTCRGPYAVLDEDLVDKVNLFVHFRCT
jgi:hypothetical protein